MVHRIREAMATEPIAAKLVGTVKMDETYIGGHLPYNARSNKGPFVGKTPVVALVERETGTARSEVMPRVTGQNVRAMIERHIDRATGVLYPTRQACTPASVPATSADTRSSTTLATNGSAARSAPTPSKASSRS